MEAFGKGTRWLVLLGWGLVCCCHSLSAQLAWQVADSFDPSAKVEQVLAQPDRFRDSVTVIESPGTYWVKLTKCLAPGRYVLFLGHIPEGELYIHQGETWQGPEPFGVLRVRNDQPAALAKDGEWLSGGSHDPDWGYSWQRVLVVAETQHVSIFLRLDHPYHFAYPLELEIIEEKIWEAGKGRVNLTENVLQGAFQGVLWGLVLYHFLLFLFYRDQALLYYTLYLVAISFTFWDYFPIGRELLFGPYPRLGKVLLEGADSIAGLLFFWFTRSFIRLYAINAIWDRRARQVLITGILTWLVVYLAYGWSLSYQLEVLYAVLAVPGMGICIWFALRIATIPNPSVRYALVGSSIMLLSTLLNSVLINSGRLGYFDLVPKERILISEFFVLIQLFVFAMGLGYRMHHTEQEKQKLTELDQMKSGFFANVSHEFRTPLTLILGPAKDLYESTASASVRTQMALILRNAQRLLHMVNQILDLAKLEGGKLQLQVNPKDLNRFLTIQVAAFESAAGQKEIKLSLDLPSEQVYGAVDPEKLEQIMTNLLSNAIRHTAAGQEVGVKLLLDNRRRRVLIRVFDTGEGIGEEHLPHIFDRFYQARTDNFTTDQPSSGIGLALTKELVELHGGEISVQSELGQGTSFQFWVPMAAAPKVQQPADAPNEQNGFSLLPFPLAPGHPAVSIPETTLSHLPHILLVEDNDDVRAYLRQCLEGKYQLQEAVDGQMGLEMAIAQLPDLIITDVMMPQKDGFMLARELKATEATDHIPIIILTGKSSSASKLEGLQTDADEYLHKPFDAMELESRIQNLLRNRKRLQARFSQQILWGQASPERNVLVEDSFLQKAAWAIEAQLAEEAFGVEELAEALHLSRTQLFRKLKALTDLSPSRFIRTVRLRHAKSLLESRSSTIAEVAYAVGFSSPTYFNRVFKEEFGKTPSEWVENTTINH